MLSRFSSRTVWIQSRVFRANREIDLTRMRSIFPAWQSASKRWKSLRLSAVIPDIASSAYKPANSIHLWIGYSRCNNPTWVAKEFSWSAESLLTRAYAATRSFCSVLIWVVWLWLVALFAPFRLDIFFCLTQHYHKPWGIAITTTTKYRAAKRCTFRQNNIGQLKIFQVIFSCSSSRFIAKNTTKYFISLIAFSFLR